MEEKIVAPFDEYTSEQGILVDDEKLCTKKSISLYDVVKVCVSALGSQDYFVSNAGINRVVFTKDCKCRKAFRLFVTQDELCLFTFECSKDGTDYLAAYALYGKMVYVLQKEEYKIIGEAEGRVQLNMFYTFQESPAPYYKYVCRFSRIAEIKKRFFGLGQPYLKLLFDRCEQKAVDYKSADKIGAFCQGYPLSTTITDGRLFSFTKL